MILHVVVPLEYISAPQTDCVVGLPHGTGCSSEHPSQTTLNSAAEYKDSGPAVNAKDFYSNRSGAIVSVKQARPVVKVFDAAWIPVN